MDSLIGSFKITNLGAGNDAIIGAGGVADLGAGDDSFTSFAPTFGLALANAQAAVGAVSATTVDGGDGADTLSTQISGDSLTGGAGADVFTVSAKTFSAVFSGAKGDGDEDARDNLIGTANKDILLTVGDTSVWTAPNAVKGAGVTIGDMNVGDPDRLEIDLVGTYTTGTAVTTGLQGLSGTVTVTTALAAARTENGGVKVLNGKGQLITLAEGSALGASVLMPVINAVGGLPATLANGAAVPNGVDFLNFLYDTNVGGTAAGGMQAAYANTTYVMFAVTANDMATNKAVNLVAYLVTANAANTGTVAVAEVEQIQIAAISGNILGAGDVYLI